MSIDSSLRKLKKEISFIGVFSIATGTTLSAGFFLLPGLAAVEAKESLVLAYIIAAIPLIPSMFSIIELSTAMPKAGGVYYFLDRTMGPMMGTIGGIGTYLALILKVAFSLIGMGAYIALFLPELEIIPIGVSIAVILGALNIVGAKNSEKFQIFLVFSLLILLIIFISGGIPEIETVRIKNIFNIDVNSLFSTAGLVYISYVGVTKVASLSEEVKNPERNLPRGILLSMITAVIIYALGTLVMVGVLPLSQLINNLTPVATAGNVIFGKTGLYLLSVAALLAFLSVANAGTLSASRYPLAMSRDHIFPRIFRNITKNGTPIVSIIFTVIIIIILLVSLNPIKIAKLASAFQLLMFASLSIAVIVMRESKIESYDPGYKSPLYPWMQLIGVGTSFLLIVEMGALTIIFSAALLMLGAVWYWVYAKEKVVRRGAIYHVFERWGKSRYDGIETELRGILKEKGLRKDDPFEDIIDRSKVLEFNKLTGFEEVVEKVSLSLGKTISMNSKEIVKHIMEGTRVGATPVTNSFALPHFRVNTIEHSEMVLVRSKLGISIDVFDPLTHQVEDTKVVHGLFFLVSPENNPTQHLRILAKIAGRVDDEDFSNKWMNATDEFGLKEALIYDDQFCTLQLNKHNKTKNLIGSDIKSIEIPLNCLITNIRRSGVTIIPKGDTILEEYDRLIIMGDPKGIEELRQIYH